MSAVEGATALGRLVAFRGELSGSGAVAIDGQFEGTVRVPGARVTIGPEARVRGGVQAQDVVVHGTFEGEVYATGGVELRDGANFTGGLFAARLSIEDNATVRAQVDPGRCHGEPAPYKPEVPVIRPVAEGQAAGHLAAGHVAARPLSGSSHNG